MKLLCYVRIDLNILCSGTLREVVVSYKGCSQYFVFGYIKRSCCVI